MNASDAGSSLAGCKCNRQVAAAYVGGMRRRSPRPRRKEPSISAPWDRLADRRPRLPLPLGHGLLVDPVALGQRPQALFTMLYRSTNRLWRCGAPVQTLAHSASFHSREKTAPSKSGIKHLLGRPANVAQQLYFRPLCIRERRSLLINGNLTRVLDSLHAQSNHRHKSKR